MEWVEMTGKSVAEAKDAALDELGVDEVDAEFEVLEEPRQGLFGRQRGEARVRARVRPTSPRPKTDRRDRKRRGKDGSNARSTTAAAADGDDPASNGGPEPAAAGSRAAGSSGADAGRASAQRPERPGRRPSRGRKAGADTPSSPPAEPAQRSRGRADVVRGEDDDEGNGHLLAANPNGGPSVPEEELSLDEQGDIASAFVTGLLDRFGYDATTSVARLEEDIVEVQVAGDDLGLLIGPKGQTLQAVQELTRTVVQRRSVARTGRILVDISGYRARRREALERFTHQVAEDVRSSGVQRVLEPMNAADRKVVHDTASGIEGVHTISEGEDPRRRVLIIPDGPAESAGSAESAADDAAAPATEQP